MLRITVWLYGPPRVQGLQDSQFLLVQYGGVCGTDSSPLETHSMGHDRLTPNVLYLIRYKNETNNAA